MNEIYNLEFKWEDYAPVQESLYSRKVGLTPFDSRFDFIVFADSCLKQEIKSVLFLTIFSKWNPALALL